MPNEDGKHLTTHFPALPDQFVYANLGHSWRVGVYPLSSKYQRGLLHQGLELRIVFLSLTKWFWSPVLPRPPRRRAEKLEQAALICP